MADDKVPSAEVATTSTEIAPAGAGAKVKKGRARSVVLLLVVAGLLSFLAVPVVYLRGEVLNTNRYVASVAPLNYNPVVADAIATRLTNELFKDLDVQHIVNTTLPGPLKGFTGSLTDQLHSYVQSLKLHHLELHSLLPYSNKDSCKPRTLPELPIASASKRARIHHTRIDSR